LIENVSTVVVVSEEDEKTLISQTESSVEMAGVEPVEGQLGKAVGSGKQLCHLIEPGTIVLPSFYEAMINMCGDFDYAYCHCAVLGKEVLRNPVPGNMVMGQLVVKSWVVSELGAKGDVMGLLNRVLAEYRGVEVPHVLAVEVSL
jgi:hypothetical protein